MKARKGYVIAATVCGLLILVVSGWSEVSFKRGDAELSQDNLVSKCVDHNMMQLRKSFASQEALSELEVLLAEKCTQLERNGELPHDGKADVSFAIVLKSETLRAECNAQLTFQRASDADPSIVAWLDKTCSSMATRRST